MRDNQILAIIIPLLRTQLADFIVNNNYLMPVPQVVQNYQPSQQPAPIVPVVLIHKLFDKRLGSPAKTNVWDEDSAAMVHTEIQQMETTFQISSLYEQNPDDEDQITAVDLCIAVSTILQSDAVISFLQNNNLGIYKISEIRNTFFKNEKDIQESSPSFDFTLTHKNTTIITSPIVQTIEQGIYPV